MKKLSALYLSLFLVLGCSAGPKVIADIIQPQSLFSGDSISIQVQDLFYADDYSSLEFGSNPYISVEKREDASVVLKASPDFSGFTVLPFRFEKKLHVLPLRVTQRRNVVFSYNPETETDTVKVFGNFNFWNRHQYPMRKQNDGSFSIGLPFEPGQYEYLFWVDGREILDPSNPDSVPNGLGGYNSPLKVKPLFEGKAPFITPVTFKDGNLLRLEYKILPHDYTGNFQKTDFIVLLDNRLLSPGAIRISGIDITVRVPSRRARRAERLRLIWSDGNSNSNLTEVILEEGVPAGNSGDFKWQDAILYSLMPDRFYDGDPSNNDPIIHGALAERANFHGGDLQGIIRKIDEGYFNELGVNTLWILPFIKNTPHPFR